jgi:ribosomal protein L2
MLASIRGSSSLLRTFSTSLISSRPPLSTCPSHSRSYATEIWKHTKNVEVEAALARSQELFKKYKPVSPGIRHLRRPLAPHLYEGRPIRALTVARRKNGGRNSHGHITVRHRGGGHKQRIRTLDYMRDAPGVHDVVRIEYDPGRSAHIALLFNQDPTAEATKKWSYIVATEGMRAGDKVQSFRQGIPDGFIPGFEVPQQEAKTLEVNEEGEQVETDNSAQSLAMGILRSMTLKPGNVLPLRLIPPGTVINNIALSPKGPGILVRSAGSFGQVIAHEEGGRYVQVRLQSGEVRKVLKDCCATIGKVSNTMWKSRQLGKAGRARWLGIRPSVRGVAMSAYVSFSSLSLLVLMLLLFSYDHPHGGGRGKSKSNKHPVSIWGWGTKGTRTRKPGPKGPKNSNKMVIRERPRGVEKRGN